MVYTMGEERGTLKKESVNDDDNGGGLLVALESWDLEGERQREIERETKRGG